MRFVEGTVEIGGDRFEDVDAFIERTAETAAEHDVTIQAFDARYVVSERHLERAAELADRERERGDAIARDRGVEILLYAAGRRQIEQALEMGVSSGTTPVVVLVDGAGDEDAAADAIAAAVTPEPTLGAYDGRTVREFFDIGDAELEATDAELEALVTERVTLLVVER